MALLLGGTAGFAVYVSRTGTIFPNVTLDGVELGGLTVSEAADRLTAAGWVKEDESGQRPAAGGAHADHHGRRGRGVGDGRRGRAGGL